MISKPGPKKEIGVASTTYFYTINYNLERNMFTCLSLFNYQCDHVSLNNNIFINSVIRGSDAFPARPGMGRLT